MSKAVKGAAAKKVTNKSHVAEPAAPTSIVGYKGFDKDFRCHGFQFEVGKTYECSGVIKICENGFHACSNPGDVWGYYPPVHNRFAEVEQAGAMDLRCAHSKIASAVITIKAELSLPQFIQRSVDCILSRVDFKNAKESNTGYRSASTNTGYRSTANVEGKNSVAMASGYESCAAGAQGCALFLVERDSNYAIIAVWAGIVGRDGINTNTFYTLKSGQPVEVAS